MRGAGGNAVCVWDVLAGGRLLHRGETHQKTVTSLCLARCEAGDGGAGPRLVTGGLDGHVKVHELDSFQVTHSIKYAGEWLAPCHGGRWHLGRGMGAASCEGSINRGSLWSWPQRP